MTEIEELKQRVAILEETPDTLRQMQLSEEMSEYISSQQRMLNITALLNSLSDTKLSVGTTEKFIQELQAKKPPIVPTEPRENHTSSHNKALQKGDKVRHKVYGEGEIVSLDRKTITVKFCSKIAKFMRDTAFVDGCLEMVD